MLAQSLKKLYGKIFSQRPPIRNLDELAKFMDEQTAFVVQKGIFEYSRARAGHYSKVLFQEQSFLDAAEASRWRAYPLGLAMVAELVESVLRPDIREEQSVVQRAIKDLALYVFDRYPTPQALGQDAWRSLRGELVVMLERIALHSPKRAMDIPVPFAKAYFAQMPIHKNLRGSDYPTITNYLKVTMCNIHDELMKRMDAKAIGEKLLLRDS
jgi:hypothetical protein